MPVLLPSFGWLSPHVSLPQPMLQRNNAISRKASACRCPRTAPSCNVRLAGLVAHLFSG